MYPAVMCVLLCSTGDGPVTVEWLTTNMAFVAPGALSVGIDGYSRAIFPADPSRVPIGAMPQDVACPIQAPAP